MKGPALEQHQVVHMRTALQIEQCHNQQEFTVGKALPYSSYGVTPLSGFQSSDVTQNQSNHPNQSQRTQTIQ